MKKDAAKSNDLTSGDVGRYLKKLASMQRDRKTGNPALASALSEISDFLIEAKAVSVMEAITGCTPSEQMQLELEVATDPSAWDHDKILQQLSDTETPKKVLLSIGKDRLGMPTARLQKMGREELVKTLIAAVEHEESIEIISKEAMAGGAKRTS